MTPAFSMARRSFATVTSIGLVIPASYFSSVGFGTPDFAASVARDQPRRARAARSCRGVSTGLSLDTRSGNPNTEVEPWLMMMNFQSCMMDSSFRIGGLPMLDSHAQTEDIAGGAVGDWLVVGWFTPDYRPLAEAFAANLTEHGAPFHLLAKPKLAPGWNTSRKPSVVVEALETYPGKTVVLMDIDCIVRDDVAPVANIVGDVGITVLARNVKRRTMVLHWIAAECSSRVVVFRNTDGARAFARRWAEEIERSGVDHDEHSMIWAFLSCPDVRFDYIAPEYSGREASKLPDGVVVHQSAHSAQRRIDRGALKRFLRETERRFFRTGRTGRDKTALSHVLKAT